MSGENRFWVDHRGRTHREPTTRGGLNFCKLPSHAALREFVFWRDGYACRHCSAAAREVPEDYDGSFAPGTDNESCLVVDHVVSRRNGGRHHPANLQALCDRCNARKSALVDSRMGAC